ncbi:hypothetical protein NPA31_000630 [Aurantimonas sp. MSK8Z-1]|uniref:hypothetical protein n=1 Tax=Mangrovibrevibacter kandeliae TaxID=2968473 RepID=UPI0021173662|nr:hypothetical protein [Aurantimonas sp. MSK8Z-1]MCW4113463.1 hypothetical protein [Aurantimonas sp. MSK8Z-1]
MTLKQTIDFSTPNPIQTDNYSLPLYQGCDFNAPFACWSINYVGGFFKFNLSLAQQQGVNLIFQLCSATSNGASNCPIDITVNGQTIARAFDPHIATFYDMVWSVPASMLRAGDNEVILKLVGGSTKVFMRYAIVDLGLAPSDLNNWMQGLPDATPLSEINIPGSHDAAAINTTVHTPYACHRFSITQQLQGGVRLLDVRLKVKKENGVYVFATCHGDIGGSSGLNEYQSFPSLLDECRSFLTANTGETVLMSLKVDDWSTYRSDSQNVLSALSSLLGRYPTLASASIPTLGASRGKMVLLNRITSDLAFGFPMSWPDSTEGDYATQSPYRQFPLYVQDKYNGLPYWGSESYKLNLVTAAFGRKVPGTVVLNFASATWIGIIGVYIMGELLRYFGAKPSVQRPATFGWILFDYQFESYQTDTYGWLNIARLVVASNRNYAGYENPFNVLGHDEL